MFGEVDPRFKPYRLILISCRRPRAPTLAIIKDALDTTTTTPNNPTVSSRYIVNNSPPEFVSVVFVT